MSKEEDSIEFDLDDILEDDNSEELTQITEIEEIEVEEIEEEVSEDSTEGDGATFQDQVREYMGELEDETEAKDEPVEYKDDEVTGTQEPELPTVPQDTLDEVESRIMSASRDLDSIVQSVVQSDTNSLAATEVDIMEAKKYLSLHKLKRAKMSVKKAEQALVTLEEDVLYLRRSIAMLHRLLKEKKIDSIEAENILLRLRLSLIHI